MNHDQKRRTHDCIVDGNLLYNIDTGSSSIGAIEVNPHIVGVQIFNGNPNHIIRNNIIHSSSTGIMLATGSLTYNNIIYNMNSNQRGILVRNNVSDSFVRRIYHNTIDLSTSLALVHQGPSRLTITIHDTVACGDYALEFKTSDQKIHSSGHVLSCR